MTVRGGAVSTAGLIIVSSSCLIQGLFVLIVSVSRVYELIDGLLLTTEANG
jgi:hypothetical protein